MDSPLARQVDVTAVRGVMTDGSGYPTFYASNVTCARTMRFAPGTLVVVDVDYFETEFGADTLTVAVASGGTTVFSGRNVGAARRAFFLPDGVAVLRWTTNGNDVHGEGWQVQWDATFGNLCGGNGADVTGLTSGVLQDGTGRGTAYGNGVACARTVRVAPGSVFAFQFDYFATEACCDRLTLTAGGVGGGIVSFAGTAPFGTQLLTLPDGTLRVEWRTDGSVIGDGWQMTWNVTTQAGNGSTPVEPPGGVLVDDKKAAGLGRSARFGAPEGLRGPVGRALGPVAVKEPLPGVRLLIFLHDQNLSV